MADELSPSGAGRRRLSQSLRNVVSNWGGYLFSMVVTFFLSPFVVHHLGNTAYGVWVLVTSLTGYLGLLDLGVRGAVTRYVAKFHAQADHEEASRIIASSLAIFAAVGVLAVLLSIVLAILANRLFQIPLAFRSDVRIILLIAGVSVACSLTGGVFGGVLSGLQRFDLMNVIDVIGTSLRAFFTVIVLLHGEGLVALSVVQLAFSLGNGLVRAWMSFRLYPQLHISGLGADREKLRLIVSFSVYSFLLTVCSYIILYTDAVVIGVFLPITFVTSFSIAGNLITYSRGVISGITTTMSPMASHLEGAGNISELRRITLKGSCYVTAIMLPISVTFLIRGSTFIGLWMGAEYAQLSGRVLWVLTLGTLISNGVAVAWAVMLGISKHKAMVPVYLVESLSNLVLSVILVQKMGVVGVAWGTTIPSLTICLLFWPWYVRRTLQISIPAYAAATWGRPALSVLPFALATYAIERWWPVSRLVPFFLQVALALPLALLGIWFLCVPAEDRQNYSQHFKHSLSALVSQS
jgi:O-antigen/teichoic acid export membrane protein